MDNMQNSNTECNPNYWAHQTRIAVRSYARDETKETKSWPNLWWKIRESTGVTQQARQHLWEGILEHLEKKTGGDLRWSKVTLRTNATH